MKITILCVGKVKEKFYRDAIEDTYKEYLKDHSEIFKGREDKFVCLMDLALMAMRKLKREGKPTPSAPMRSSRTATSC